MVDTVLDGVGNKMELTELNMIHNCDCLDFMRTLPDNCIDSVVTDPPYGLKFMGKKWDYDVPKVEIWQEVFRVLKPGAHALIACGTRTQHRMVCNIEDAGFEIRDVIVWAYGSGFPKSLNIGKEVDKIRGNERERIAEFEMHDIRDRIFVNGENKKMNHTVTKGNSEWDGWGTALKPAVEFFTLVRKPIAEKTIAENVLKHGTGGINIDGCRVAANELTPRNNNKIGCFNFPPITVTPSLLGRFPANLIHDGSDEVESCFPETKSSNGEFKKNDYDENETSTNFTRGDFIGRGDSGSASRFFYCAKASRKERELGIEKNTHPTVKPVELMRYLCRLITPPKCIVFDLFAGSGSTGVGAIAEGFNFVGVEREQEYCEIARARIQYALYEIDKDLPFYEEANGGVFTAVNKNKE